MLLLNLLGRDLCGEFLGSWLVGSFLPSWKILHFQNFSREGRATYKVGILNFLKSPFASEESYLCKVSLPTITMLLRFCRRCFWKRIGICMTPNTVTPPDIFVWKHLVTGIRANWSIIEKNQEWVKSCPHCYQEEFGFCLQQPPVLSYFFFDRKKDCIFSFPAWQEVCLLCVELSLCFSPGLAMIKTWE